MTSAFLVREFLAVVTRPRIRDKYPVVGQRIDAVIGWDPAGIVMRWGPAQDDVEARRLDSIIDFLLLTERTALTTVEDIVSEDPADNYVLATAVAGEADYLVTGDHHLLALRSHHRVKIVSAAEFLDVFT